MLSCLYGPTLTSTHDYWKNHSFNYTDLCPFVSKTVSLFFNILSRFVVFLPRNKCLNFMAAVTICEYRSLHFFISCISNVYCELGRIGTLPLGENSLSIPQLELFPYEHALPCPL